MLYDKMLNAVFILLIRQIKCIIIVLYNLRLIFDCGLNISIIKVFIYIVFIIVSKSQFSSLPERNYVISVQNTLIIIV